jgi:hypothetical protein
MTSEIARQGCIAVTNDEIEEYGVVPDGTTVLHAVQS